MAHLQKGILCLPRQAFTTPSSLLLNMDNVDPQSTRSYLFRTWNKAMLQFPDDKVGIQLEATPTEILRYSIPEGWRDRPVTVAQNVT